MSTDDLIGNLRGGDLASRGQIEIDFRAARSKLERYQLKDPHHYVLHLVKAAARLGATRIDFEIGADQMRMKCDGVRLGTDDLEGLWSAPFSADDGTATGAAVRQLAVAFTAALALEPDTLEIVSGDSGRGTRWLLEGEDETVELVATPTHGTRVHLRERFRASHLMEFVRSFTGVLAEERALFDHCRFAECLIECNGELVSIGPEEKPAEIVSLESELGRGRAWVTHSWRSTKAHLLDSGVLVETLDSLPIDEAFRAVRLLVEPKQASLNLSQTAFLRDDAFDAVLNELAAPLTFLALAGFVRGLEDGAESWFVRELANTALRHHATLLAGEQPVPNELTELLDALAGYPMWALDESPVGVTPFIGPRDVRLYRLQDFEELIRDDTKLYYVFGYYGQGIPDEVDDAAVLLCDLSDQAADPAALAASLGKTWVDLTTQVRNRALARWWLGRDRWPKELDPVEPRLRLVPCARHFEVGDYSCGLGLLQAGRTSELWFAVYGELGFRMHRRLLPDLGVRGVVLLVATKSITTVEEALDAVALRFTTEFADWVTEDLPNAHDGAVPARDVMLDAISGWADGSLLGRFERAFETKLPWAPARPWRIERLLEGDESDRDQAAAHLRSVADAPLFGSDEQTLAELRTLIRDGEVIVVVPPRGDADAAAATGGVVVKVSPRQEAALRAWFADSVMAPGDANLLDAVAETRMRRLRDRLRTMAGAVPPELWGGGSLNELELVPSDELVDGSGGVVSVGAEHALARYALQHGDVASAAFLLLGVRAGLGRDEPRAHELEGEFVAALMSYVALTL